MGVEHSKPRTSSCRKLSYQVLNGSIIFSNGDKYTGDFKDGQLTGNGTYHYANGDVYKGEWRCNKKHGFGIQIYAKQNRKYVGHWQDNLPYGEGTLYYDDGSYYTGSFLEAEKHGEGIFYDTEGDGYEEMWVNGELTRRSPLSPFKQRNSSSRTTSTANKKGSKEDLNDENNSDNHADSRTKSLPKSEGNENKSESDEEYSDSRKSKARSKDKDYDEKQLHSNVLFRSREYDSSDIKYEVGVDTLNIIEHMDMLNSVAGVLLNKDVQEWTYKDVGDWLRHLGLNDYIEAFKKNHIDGSVLFDITEADLKDEFGMMSVGHRKNFVKAVDNLKRIFCSGNEKNSDYVRHKIQKFYERNRPNTGRSLFSGGLRLREGKFYSHRFNPRNTYHSQHEVIEEDDELNLGKNEPTPSPQVLTRKGTFEGKDELKRLTEQVSKTGSPKPKKPTWDAIDEPHSKGSSGEDRYEFPARGQPSKRTLSKISSGSQKSSPGKDEQNMLKQEHEPVEEFKSSRSKKGDKESSGEGSSSESSTDSEPSDEEKANKKVVEEKPPQESSLPPEMNPLKATKAHSKYDKKLTKKITVNNQHIFRSAELPIIQRSPSNKSYGKNEKPRQKKPHTKNNLNEKIKDEILRIFKDSGLNENFIIDYNEITFDKKIGEGGYGRVFLGKFSGIDVAIKEYGKTKLDVRRAEDFVKEVEVISNLRHPNIVLCMGACIHNGKYLMITEYLEEGSLFDHLHKKHTKINDETMINIIEDIALGMCYLHGRKVFHCDLKSSNILIDSSWSVKLCDFGLSRVKYKSDRKRFQKQRVGTPHWMAPEILRGEKYDESADVYSFGMILWELVMGEIPYHNTPISDIIATVGYEGKQINLPVKGNPLILSIIKSCLSLNKNERPTFKQIVDQLQQKTKGALAANKKNNLFSIFGS